MTATTTKKKVKKVTKKAKTKAELSAARSRAMKAIWAKRASKVFPPVTETPEKVITVEGLSAADVKDIIRLCASSEIKSFQYGGLRLLFDKHQVRITERPSRQRGSDGLNELKVIKPVSGVTNKQELQEASDAAMDELEHLKLTNPAEYEEFIMSEDAINDGSGH